MGSAIYDTSTYDVGLYGSSGVTKGHKWIDFYAESMRFKFYNQTLTNSYTINNMEIGYEGGARGD